MTIIYFLVAIFASTIGSISGMGGGVIIKPVMDALGGLSPSQISFLSSCTVLTMSISTFIRGRKNSIVMNYSITIPLTIGAAVGGVLGKSLFSMVTGNVTLIQSILLFFINIGVFLYVKNKSKIKTKNVVNPILCITIGFLLGMVSSFLGIGGGPINIAVLYYFFSMSPKLTAKNSIFVILFSQLASLATIVVTNSVPEFSILTLGLMCFGGISGAIIGASFSARMDEDTVEKFFTIVLIALILLNLYNIVISM